MAMDKGHEQATALVAAARACVGVPFRPQGRGAGGLDCLGLILTAAAAGGVRLVAPADYRLTGHGPERLLAELAGAGALPLSWPGLAGDLLVGVPFHGQVHLALRTPVGLVEAHAGLRRVIERPFAGDERRRGGWLGAWRLPDPERKD